MRIPRGYGGFNKENIFDILEDALDETVIIDLRCLCF
jgi:hypothetical protein